MSGAYALARPLLYALDAERAHWLTVRALAAAPALAGWVGERVEDPVALFGLSFGNRVGLAAGADKDALAVRGFAGLGFGFVEVGTLTPRAQGGNPRPRVFRAVRQGAVINRLGFNNGGIDAAMARLRSRPEGLVVGVNIGKNRDTAAADAADDYRYCLQRAHDVADYITVNISSPNTPGLRDLQQDDALMALLGAIAEERARLADAQGRRTPVLLKLAPDLTDDAIASLAATAREHGIDGLIATNTTVTRPEGLPAAFADQAGGLSGRPLAPLAGHVMRTLRRACGPDYPLVGVGGIDSPEAARQRIADGADLIQLYTGLVYEGPSLPARLAGAVRDGARS
ncbi:quinone-dependent dihydroorotate dehydrogenase [Algiphilus sp.]|uniref:quinone-dependent dihydroorotate dehydrogenase n=1 Tax=Algiphilus sp. TaxID=1872431 RepID=UPI0025C042F6|nr:quinone-dependent dihydroorotate dehydrogenase [Algiphilus sp.]MCK5770241.1 quinone-dependent dihydroorotate dehydrogenase [Algiphilus sp.]